MRRMFIHVVLIFFTLCWPTHCFSAQPEPGTSPDSGKVLPASSREAPRMQLGETSFDFGEVLEGSIVSHDFIVWNIGTGVLKIDQVGPTCACLKADFDESIPPGGTGRITLTVDFSDHKGPLERTVGVLANDPADDDATLSVKGTGIAAGAP